MGSTRINVGAVIGLSSQIQRANSIVSSVRTDLHSTRSRIDGRVLRKNNLSNRLQTVSSQLSSVENRISRIKETAERGANNYLSTDLKVRSWSSALTEDKISTKGALAKVNVLGFSASDEYLIKIAKKYFSLFSDYVSDKIGDYVNKVKGCKNAAEIIIEWYDWFHTNLYSDFDKVKSLIENVVEEMTFRKPELLPSSVSDFFDILSDGQVLIDVANSIKDWRNIGDGWQAYEEIGVSFFKAIAKKGNKWLDKKTNLKYLGVDKQVQSVLLNTIIKMPKKWIDGIKNYAENDSGTAGSIVTETVVGSIVESVADAAKPVYVLGTAVTYPVVNQICQGLGYDLSGQYKSLTGKTGLSGVFAAQKELWVDIVYDGFKENVGDFLDNCYGTINKGWKNWVSGINIMFGKEK